MMRKQDSGVRQAELMMALSLATDFGTGRPMEWAVCSALIGVRLGEALGLSDQELREVYYVALLRHIGCTADVSGMIDLMGDDPAAAGAAYSLIDTTQFNEMLGWMLRYAGVGQPPHQRLRAVVQMPSAMPYHVRENCEVAQQLAASLGFEKSIQNSLWHTFENWDGSGMPQRVKGEGMTLPSRIAQLAQHVETYRRVGGVEAAANSLLAQGKVFPANSLIMGTPAKVVRDLTPDEIASNERSAETCVRRARAFREGKT